MNPQNPMLCDLQAVMSQNITSHLITPTSELYTTLLAAFYLIAEVRGANEKLLQLVEEYSISTDPNSSNNNETFTMQVINLRNAFNAQLKVKPCIYVHCIEYITMIALHDFQLDAIAKDIAFDFEEILEHYMNCPNCS